MNNELKKAAEILVECGYAYKISDNLNDVIWRDLGGCRKGEEVEPFEDTLEGRRQADAIEDWLGDKYVDLAVSSKANASDNVKTRREFRINCIKWCLEQLTGEDNE